MKIFKSILRKIIRLPRRTKIIGVLAILLVLFFVARGRNKTTPLSYAVATKNDISAQVSASGVLSGKNTATLRFAVPGRLSYFSVNMGQHVYKGQTIASLDSTILNANLQEALNNRRNTQAVVDNIYDQLKNHSTDETFSQRAARTAAEAANDNAWDMVLAAKRALADSVLYSPIDGTIVTKGDFSFGQNVGVTDVIAQVVDFSEKDFLATVDESDISKVQVGQEAKVTLNTYGDSVFNGKVVEISGLAQTEATGGVTIQVKIKVDDPKIAKIYGLNGQANIVITSAKNVLTVPQDALVDEAHVYAKCPIINAKCPKGYEKREVQIGIKSDTDVEIVSGLTDGEQVVTNPQAVK